MKPEADQPFLVGPDLVEFDRRDVPIYQTAPADLACDEPVSWGAPLDRLYASVLTSLIGEGAREVAVAKTRAQAGDVIDAVIEYARRLMADGPWKPDRALQEARAGNTA